MSKRILIVDDDEGIRDGLEILLMDEGYEVLTAENGKVALDRLNKEPLPELILLDLMMPVMDGREFCEKRKSDERLASIPTVVLTAGALTEDVLALPVSDRMCKPVDIEVLLEVVHRYI